MKKIVALIIALSLSFSFPVFAANISDKAVSEEYLALESLDIIPKDIIYNPNKKINKGDFAYMVAKMLGYEENEIPMMHFNDLQKEHYATGEIEYLYQAGIIDGYSEKLFKPGSDLKYGEAIEILLRTMGIKEYANQYKNKYFPEKNIKSDNTALTYGMAVEYIYQAMNCRVYTNSIEDGYFEYKVSDETVLEKWRHISRYEGTVTAVGYKSIVGGSTRYGFEVGGLSLTVNNPGDFDCLGFYSEVYYYNDKAASSGEVIIANAMEKYNSCKKFSLDGAYYQNGKLFYLDGNRERSVKIPAKSFISYNNEAAKSDDLEKLFDVDDGFVTINEIKKDDCTIVMIEAYENYVVSGKSSEENKIYTENGTTVVYDEYGIFSIRDAMGNRMNFDALEKNDVISVMQDKSGRITEVTVSRETASVKVAAVFNDDGVFKITGGGKTYDAVKNISSAYIPTAGNTYLLYMNFEGKVVWSAVDATDFVYGYLCRVRNDTDYDESRFYFDIFTAQGEIKRFIVDEKIKVDNINCKSYKILLEALYKGSGKNDEYQPIRYKTNAKGDLKEIDTAYINKSGGESEKSMQPVFKCYTSNHDVDSSLGLDTNGIVYSEGNFENYFVVNNNSTRFRVPASYQNEARLYNAGFALNNARYFVDAYTSDPDSLTADFLIQYSSTGIAPVSSMMGVIEAVSYTLNSEDEPVYNLTIRRRMAGQRENRTISAEFSLKDLPSKDSSVIFDEYVPAVGDCLQYSVNNDGEIVNMCVYYSTKLDKWCFSKFATGTYEGSRDHSKPNTVLSAGERMFMGCLYKKRDNIIQLALEDTHIIIGNPNTRSMDIPNTAIIYCVGKNGKMREITVNELRTYTDAGKDSHKLVVMTYYNKAGLVVAYE